ncbi:MAG: hypothetical protein P8J14_08885, partial [Emcibacteraceae bacterium]|nr:hypothetical protein [Emcibacteraceae bacterium]
MFINEKQLSLKRQFYVICFLAFSSVLSVITVDILIESSQNRIDQASNHRFLAHQLAGEFKRTIDDLQNTVQDYVTFGDVEIAENHKQISLIFSGKIPRPANYNQIYRNMPEDFGYNALNLDPNMSLLYHLNNSGISQEELAPIIAASKDYEDLIVKQQVIIEMVMSDSQKAMLMLNDKNYTSLNNKVMTPVINFINFQE